MKAGFFIGEVMSNRIWHENGTWNLKTFFSISLGFHLLSLSILTLLFRDFKIDRLPPLNLEVSLILPVLSAAAEEKTNLKSISSSAIKIQIKKEDKEWMQPSLQSVVKNIPIEEPKPLPQPREEEKTEKDPVDVKELQCQALTWDKEVLSVTQGITTSGKLVR